MFSGRDFGLFCSRGITQLMKCNLTEIKVCISMPDESFTLHCYRFN